MSLQRLDNLVDAIFEEAFGDPKTQTSRWPHLTFDAACSDQTSRSEKLQRGDYLESGKFPVIDQGQSRIAGWTDDCNLLCKSQLPVIVFGDHTRAVKFVDFPFIIGADGAKFLRPSEAYIPTYFAHLLRLLPLLDLGYSRHMRELKRLTFPRPPVALQVQFANRVATVADIRRMQEEHLAQLNAMFSSLQDRAFNGEL